MKTVKGILENDNIIEKKFRELFLPVFNSANFGKICVFVQIFRGQIVDGLE